ncbi:gamma-butyrobetaine hydroxylase-like domain-containing protein [Marinobacter sp. X15-166B]|uniref:gamma-butyrobetaine hydroxylase-like domain-containing protein n=1 Tax=Marinobacter sp. X15-166B TaxID=1897620 RepID=UPI00085C291F|nr:DUF971 domain-containing protein [Marinobacter sp. X15-166B]OEY66612.1 1-(5-phosphoribosyl)-5-((5-phosphoribosylamino)methylideneamino)imidazole-4-carboxamide isomerase [Marinobacter sp. X15-166B]
MSSAQPPVNIRVRKQSRVLELEYADGTRYQLAFELLRVYSPSAEVRGHGSGPGVLQTGKRDVAITGVNSVGNYALQLVFSDGHDSGLFTWHYLRELGEQQEAYWQRYLRRLAAEGGSREG